MNMKKAGLLSVVGLTTVMLAGFASNTLADGHKNNRDGDHGRHGKMEMRDPSKAAEHLSKRLGLDAATTAKVTTLFEATATEQKALHEKRKLELHALLTPEQIEKFEAMQTRRGKHSKAGMGSDPMAEVMPEVNKDIE